MTMARGGMKPGDWMCEACGNHNFASRQVCNKCAGPHSGTAVAASPPPVTPVPVPTSRAYGPVVRTATNGAGKQELGRGVSKAPVRAAPYDPAPPSSKPIMDGDWMCPQCNNHNFASRVTCKRCDKLREGFKRGDWVCRPCRNHNFASRHSCNKCSVPRPPEVGGAGFRMPLQSMMGMMPGMGGGMGGGMGLCMQPWLIGGGDVTRPGGGPSALKSGDWQCPMCVNHNFASRVNCNNCGKLRQGFKVGDWVCRSCRNHNFQSRQECNKCQAQKPLEMQGK
eukprot:NODE_10708_length_1334_cov_5.347142.p2 GENE.NODE_10708_length_1334_cov_5.347142~~NODE_10708_length_1334_cov_5.347142.p2  ORF type:complete len:280 (+),score=58.63 NODE_10708_length_1334_cov_5.347142:104-943(+)